MRDTPGTGLPDDARLFLLQVWRHGGAFRAALRAPGEETAHRFDGAEALTAYVLQLAAASPAARPSPPPPLEDPR